MSQTPTPTSDPEPTPTHGDEGGFSTGRRFSLVLVILAAAALAGWGAFAAITWRSGYGQALRRFDAEAAKHAHDEVRLVDSDRTYHRPFHRRDEGRLGTLPEAMRLGYERCKICSPPTMAEAPRRPLAWIGGIGVFVLLSAGLLRLYLRTCGLATTTKRGLSIPNAPLPSHLAELTQEFESLRARSDALLRHLTGEARGYSPQTEALSIAVLRWGARWTHRELAALQDVEHLEESVTPPEVTAGPSTGDISAVPSRSTQRGRWLQQQFEYLQLLWRAGEYSTEQARLAARKRLLDHLILHAHATETQTGLASHSQVMDELAAIMAASVDFFHKYYAPDSHLRSRRNTPMARRT